MTLDGTATELVSRDARASDLPAVERLLADAALPLDGVAAAIAELRVLEHHGQVVGAAALEQHGEYALLRSLVVEPSRRGGGLARRLVADRMARAEALGVDAVFLLTTTAERFFSAAGFERIERSVVPDAIRASAEFASICPTSAAVMRRPSGGHTQ
jgi:amino-acid N-acetyltransferase